MFSTACHATSAKYEGKVLLNEDNITRSVCNEEYETMDSHWIKP